MRIVGRGDAEVETRGQRGREHRAAGEVPQGDRSGPEGRAEQDVVGVEKQKPTTGVVRPQRRCLGERCEGGPVGDPETVGAEDGKSGACARRSRRSHYWPG